MCRRNAIRHTFIPLCWCGTANQPLDQQLFFFVFKIQGLIDNATSTKWDKSVMYNITICLDVE
jgi:hypothetical protein